MIKFLQILLLFLFLSSCFGSKNIINQDIKSQSASQRLDASQRNSEKLFDELK